MANPIDVTSVLAVPLHLSGAQGATGVEDGGDCITAANPQTIINERNTATGISQTSGDNKQHAPEAANANAATGALPTFSDMRPPITHPMEPIAMIANDPAA